MGERIDKWLWAVRAYKTRGDAADACKTNRVAVNGAWAKASRELKAGDEVAVRKGVVTFTFRVIEPAIGGRQPARNVPLYAENITPPEELAKLDIPRETVFVARDRGTGRPTKKERRDIDDLMDDIFL